MSSDSTSPHVRLNDYWGRWTKVGVHGDPTVASAAKGERVFESVVARLIEVVDELRAWPIEERSDQHAHPIQPDVRW